MSLLQNMKRAAELSNASCPVEGWVMLDKVLHHFSLRLLCMLADARPDAS